MQKTLVSLSVLLSVCLAGVQSLAADSDLWQGYTGKGFLKSPSRPVVDLPESMMTHLRTVTSFTLPLSSQRERRGMNCGLLEAVLEHTPIQLGETADTMQAMWVGQDAILMVASSRGLTGNTTVWRGVPNAIGEFSLTANHKAITKPIHSNSLQVSPAGMRNTVVAVSSTKMFLFVSRNGGQAWTQYSLPSSLFDPTNNLYLSHKNPRHMVLLTKNGKLYVSDSGGERWSHVSERVVLAEFATGRGSTWNEYLYYSTTSSETPYNPLYRMDIASRTTHVIDHTAYRFRVDGKYLFVSRQNYTKSAAAQTQSRRLYVSRNYDSPHVLFTEVQLPSLKPEQLYVVMGTHETGAFIHLADKPKESRGNLYTSDSSGSKFSVSLRNHLYKLVHYGFVHFSINDFYEVQSMRGVYITTTVADDDGHITMITFNNGGQWQRLRPPTNSPHCHYPACSLHLHLRYSRLIAPKYNLSLSTGPLSTNSSVGIILAHGSLGSVRNDSNPRFFVSSDGGYTWKDPGLPGGTYVYGIADYGNIIAVAPDSEHSTFIWFSHDRGACFVRQQLDSTSVFSLTRGLLMDPSAASRFAFVMGVEGVGNSDAWKMISLNFGTLLRTKCQKSDYHSVTEHATATSCLLGYRNVYNLTKSSSICYNEKGYNYNPVHQKRCHCDYTDYECDYGYNRTSSTACSPDGTFSLASVCPPGTSTYTRSKSGFRLISGDLCIATDQSQSLLKVERQSCTGHEQGVGNSEGTGGMHLVDSTAGKIVGVFVIVVASLLAALLCLYCWLKFRSRAMSRERVFYQRLPLHESSKFSANEDSSSDEDLIKAS